jgi:hypothetical protein
MTFTVIACNNSKDKNDLSDKDISINKITSAEENLFDDIEPDKEKANSMIQMYLEFVQNYPKDTLSPEYLFKASEIAIANGLELNAGHDLNLDNLKYSVGYSFFGEHSFDMVFRFLYLNFSNVQEIILSLFAIITWISLFVHSSLIYTQSYYRI